MQQSVNDLLVGLEKDELVALINRLVENDPDLYDDLELAIPVIKRAALSKPPAYKERRSTQVSEQMYRKQVKLILRQNSYEDRYDEFGSRPAYLDDLEEMLKTAKVYLNAGDAEGALIILRILLEETTENYDSDMDYEGDVAGFIQSLGMPMAEAILSVDLDDQARRDLGGVINELLETLSENIEESELEVISTALEYGWGELPDEETQANEDDDYDETWMDFGDLQQARLNVLERQGRTAEFLQLAQTENPYRYTLKLLELGRVDDAIAASQNLWDEQSILSVAQKLRDVGRLDEAIALAERRLTLVGPHNLELATWLAPLEEARGKIDLAMLAYRAAFDARPAIAWYRHLKRLSGANWSQLRPVLMQKVNESMMTETMIDISLEEKEWDAAIAIAEKHVWSYYLLENVADAVIPYRPDWVIRISLNQSDQLIEKTQSKLYPAAARWLARAKKAYQVKGQDDRWQAYITNLRATFARRPALQREIARL
jgi:uncharacterized Zn finger protein